MDVQSEIASDMNILSLVHEWVSPLTYTHMLPIVACTHSLHGVIYIVLINHCTRRYRVRRRLQQVDEAQDRAGSLSSILLCSIMLLIVSVHS